MVEKLIEQYNALNTLGNRDLLSVEVPKLISEIDVTARTILSDFQTEELRSLIPNKEYFVFKDGNKISRPINKKLFNLELPSLHSEFYKKNSLATLSKEEIASLFYTLSMSFCAAIDTLHSGNKKTPATFFEKYIGNIFSRELGVKPTTALEMLNEDSLATDYIYKTPEGSSDIHLQVKLSTRERAIEAWAHQRIIDGIFGIGSYRGILVVMSETNIKRNNMSVADVCVPNQWGVYQKYIAKLYRIYYLDIPTRTENLHLTPPYIQVKHLSDFFSEKERVLLPSSE